MKMKLTVVCEETHDEQDDMNFGQVLIKLEHEGLELARVEYSPQPEHDTFPHDITVEAVKKGYYGHVCNGGFELKYQGGVFSAGFSSEFGLGSLSYRCGESELEEILTQVRSAVVRCLELERLDMEKYGVKPSEGDSDEDDSYSETDSDSGDLDEVEEGWSTVIGLSVNGEYRVHRFSFQSESEMLSTVSRYGRSHVSKKTLGDGQRVWSLYYEDERDAGDFMKCEAHRKLPSEPMTVCPDAMAPFDD